MSTSLVGLGCLFIYALSQGARDAFFGNALQSLSFLLVAILAFGTSTICFATVAWFRQPRDFALLLSLPTSFVFLNLTTAAGWLTFLFGLKYLEPAVVATLFNGVGPLIVLSLEKAGYVSRSTNPSTAESLCYAGLALTLVGIVAVVVDNRSGLPSSDLQVQLAAIGAVLVGGAAAVISHVIARSFNDKGVGAHAMMGTRFLLALAIAAVAELAAGDPELRPTPSNLPLLAFFAFVLLTLPSFMLQLGIARSSPLAVNVMRALGPVFVFIVQQLDGRLQFSGATLVCVTAFCLLAAGASILRGLEEIRESRWAVRFGR